MDRVIAQYPAVADGDLMRCAGVSYARDMRETIAYDRQYFEKCAAYDPEIAYNVVQGRNALINRHWPSGGRVLDVGVGAGDFVASRPNTYGYDINPYAVQWLKQRRLYRDDFESFSAFSFWDTIEHVRDPHLYFDRILPGSLVFVSLPVFRRIDAVRASKHYRPGEHFYYFTERGAIEWMGRYGYQLLEISDHERVAGRESVSAFAFRRG